MAQSRMTEEEMQKKVRSLSQNLDEPRLAGLELAFNLQTGLQEQLKQERERLAVKYGAGHPRVIQLQEQLKAGRQLAEGLKVEITRSKIEVPDLPDNTWRVHGRVVTENYTGVEEMTVALYTPQGRWLRELGYSCTDAQGYFVLDIPGRYENLVNEYDHLFLTVTDADQQFICRDSEPVKMESAEENGYISVYREILLTEEMCATPPEEVEDILEEPAVPHPKFVVYPGDDGRFYFHLTDNGGEVILHSRGYARKESALNGIGAVRRNAAEERIERLGSEEGPFSFELIAANGQVLGRSKEYASEADRDAAIPRFISFLSDASVEEKS